jgi:hypothetical protein
MKPIQEFNVVGGNIEGPFGSHFGKMWICSATSLDVIAGDPVISKVDGKILSDFGVLTDEHAKHKEITGPLKESIIADFPDIIGLNVAIIKYYLDNIVPVSNGRFHVHVHRGKTMGSEHIAQIRKRLVDVDSRLSFGFGYNPTELSTDNNGEIVDVYYSVSLIVGFDTRYKTGTTFIPSSFTDFRSPPIYDDTPYKHKPNHLNETIGKIVNLEKNSTIVLNSKIAVLEGIFIPENPHIPVECCTR